MIRLKEKKVIREHLDIDGAEFIANTSQSTRHDIYKINTFAAAEQFVEDRRVGVRAGVSFFQSENTFNTNIPSRYTAYFICPEDTNHVKYGIIKNNNNVVNHSLHLRFDDNLYYELSADINLENDQHSNEISIEDAGDLDEIPNIHFRYNDTDYTSMADIIAEINAEHQDPEDNDPEDVNIELVLDDEDNNPEAADLDLIIDRGDNHEEEVSTTDVETETTDTEPSDVNREVPNNTVVTANRAYPFRYKDVKGNIHITGYYPHPADDKITIPAEIDGKPVTDIDPFAFYNCEKFGINYIYLPASITNIGKAAFYQDKPNPRIRIFVKNGSNPKKWADTANNGGNYWSW